MEVAEDILIGTWLQGEHLEDLKHVDPKHFSHPEVIRDLKSGLKPDQIYTKHRRIVMELVQYSTIRMPAAYQSAIIRYVQESVKEELKGETDLNRVRARLDYLDKALIGPVRGAEDYAVTFLKEIERRSKQETIKWDKMPTIQNLTAGIKRKELTAIAARPSVGKSAFALQVAYGAWKQGAKVLYFPLEMSAVQTFSRILIREGYATSKELQTGKIKDFGKYQIGIDLLDEIEKSERFRIYEGEGQIENIEQIIDQEKPFLVVIDQLTQMKAAKSFKDIRSQFSYMTSNLKRIAMQHDVAVALLCQINRSADNTIPTMANLKESGSIEEDSDNVILMHRFRQEDLENGNAFDWNKERPMRFELAKQRDGEVGDWEVMFLPAKMTFLEKEKKADAYM